MREDHLSAKNSRSSARQLSLIAKAKATIRKKQGQKLLNRGHSEAITQALPKKHKAANCFDYPHRSARSAFIGLRNVAKVPYRLRN
jgi:hypothetical protein